jgi:hypothetical protein
MRKTLITAFCLFLYSCSVGVSSLYNHDHKLTTERAFSTISNLSVTIPEGWFAAEENECNCLDIWLVKNDYSATLNFGQLFIDDKVLTLSNENELKQAAEFSKVFIKAKMGKNFTSFLNEEHFKIGNYGFYAFEFRNEENRIIRIVVFKHREKFFELKAIPAKEISTKELFIVQNSVLSSIR